MELTDAQKKRLKGLAHALHPIILIGQQGLKDTILVELNNALEYHQLVKIKINAGDRELRNAILEQILEHASEAVLIQKIGNTAVLYQRNPERPYLLSSSQ
ncbi:YhbY family RNA-binding protein [uncultured Thiothrix sp.]|uniref:YhbY family RNA-binding protein n=1 Tax=uncultured Thiothrix sp. TaxID=223185 RepID=UPI002603DE70|nr:YhbY family RNA-binding protein [uncultured Thiothrix sp.]HMT94528.1 YhbY family RNA-binding protein [Thiolinea sp.]